jgi:hypothetical protein
LAVFPGIEEAEIEELPGETIERFPVDAQDRPQAVSGDRGCLESGIVLEHHVRDHCLGGAIELFEALLDIEDKDQEVFEGGQAVAGDAAAEDHVVEEAGHAAQFHGDAQIPAQQGQGMPVIKGVTGEGTGPGGGKIRLGDGLHGGKDARPRERCAQAAPPLHRTDEEVRAEAGRPRRGWRREGRTGGRLRMRWAQAGQ